jgi:hypothetical protein
MALNTLRFTINFVRSVSIVLCILLSFKSSAQPVKKINSPVKFNTKEFVISYAIVVNGDKPDRISQTYNGGLKTAFVKNDLVRLRLVSLMRVQSIYFNNKKGLKTKVAAVVKESGKERAKMYLNAKEWKQYNKKSDSARVAIYKDDTLRILDQLCTKAVITTKDSATLTVYYLPTIKSKQLMAAEPLFALIPGLVMKYVYVKDTKSIEYTAVSLKSAPILSTVFAIPTKDYINQKYNPGGATINSTDLNEEDDDDGTEEEETEMLTPPPATTAPVKTPPPLN